MKVTRDEILLLLLLLLLIRSLELVKLFGLDLRSCKR